MRPIATRQDALRFPLNELLGREAHVRVLRTLDEMDGPASAPKIAELANLTTAGTRKALDRLSTLGFVERVGEGRGQQYKLCRRTHMADALAQLFEAERRRYNELLNELRMAANRLTPPPISVWISMRPDRLGDPLVLWVLHTASSLSDSIRQLRNAVHEVETEFDLTIEVRGCTQADLPAVDPSNLTLLAGIPPTKKDQAQKWTGEAPSHVDLDNRSKARAQALATLVKESPSLVRRAQRHVNRLLSSELGAARHDLEEWRDILQSYSQPRLLRFLTSESPRALRLRQSSPLIAVLEAKERDRLVAAKENE